MRIIVAIQVILLGVLLMLFGKMTSMESRLARVETQSSLLNAAYQLSVKTENEHR